MKQTDKLTELLCDFWEWLDIPRDEYDLRSRGNDLEEYFFPKFEELINVTCCEISAGNLDLIDDIL